MPGKRSNPPQAAPSTKGWMPCTSSSMISTVIDDIHSSGVSATSPATRSLLSLDKASAVLEDLDGNASAMPPKGQQQRSVDAATLVGLGRSQRATRFLERWKNLVSRPRRLLCCPYRTPTDTAIQVSQSDPRLQQALQEAMDTPNSSAPLSPFTPAGILIPAPCPTDPRTPRQARVSWAGTSRSTPLAASLQIVTPPSSSLDAMSQSASIPMPQTPMKPRSRSSVNLSSPDSAASIGLGITIHREEGDRFDSYPGPADDEPSHTLGRLEDMLWEIRNLTDRGRQALRETPSSSTLSTLSAPPTPPTPSPPSPESPALPDDESVVYFTRALVTRRGQL